MIIHTRNEAVAALVAPYGIQVHDADYAFIMPPSTTIQQLDRLCTILTTDHAGQWSVSFDGEKTGLSYEDLTKNVDGEHWQAMLLAPGYIGADSEDLIYWLEEVYGQPVTNENYKRVAQLFRYWYACAHPAEYVNPPDAIPAKYAKLQLAHPADNKAKQARRNQRRIDAVARIGYDTLDTFAAAALALSPEDAERVKAILRKS
jgi:hypothetical protein